MVDDTPDGTNQYRRSPSAQHLIPDVLVEILLQCSLGGKECENEYESLFPKPSIHSSPLILGRVCHSWRQVALSTPQLWSYLCVPDTWNSPVGMSEWLKRSGSSPLTFSLFDKRHENPLYRIDALNVLLANAHRWKHVEVDADIKLISLFLHSVESGAPLLQELQIRDHHDWTDEEDFSYCVELDLPRYSRLTCLYLPEGVRMILHHQNVILHNLRNLRFTFLMVDGPGAMSMDDYLALFSLCPMLEDASFAITGSKPLNRTDDMIALRIRNLCIFVPVALNIGSFFDHLSLPHLIDLQIHDTIHGTPREFPWKHITSLLRRSQASLIRFDISWELPANARSDDDLLFILHLTPNIQSIFLDRLLVSDVLLHALTQSTNHGETSSCLCPKLVHVSVAWGDFCEAAVKNMILSPHRLGGPTPFKRICLYDCCVEQWMFDADEDIQKCIMRGLSLEIRTLGW